MSELLELGRGPLLFGGIMISLLTGTLVMVVFTRFELNSVKNDYYSLLHYLGGGESPDILRELASILRRIERDNRSRDRDVEQLYMLLESCIQKVAVIRYNAFQNVGNDLSFSVALLDSEDNGVVISGIYGRDSSTTYLKPISAGGSYYVLTEEEEDAIGLARRTFIEKSYYKGGR
jgi:hypothetical protein